MRNKHLTPMVFFCAVFLLYTIYFVKVVRSPETPEKSKVLTVLSPREDSGDQGQRLSEIGARDFLAEKLPSILSSDERGSLRYVNFSFLNVREQPTTASPIVEVLSRNDEVQMFDAANEEWVEIRTSSGNRGFVSQSYLSEKAAAVPDQLLVEVPVILYHHITDEPVTEPAVLILKTANFYAQLGYLSRSGVRTISFEDLLTYKASKTSPPKGSIILAFDDGYINHYQVAKDLKSKNMKGVFFIVTDLVGQPGYLTWHQIREMSEWGMEIASQGKSHAYLGNATNEQIQDEIAGSKTVLENELRKPVYAFAYPSGEYTPRTLKAVEEAGYAFARTMASGSQYYLNDPYRIPVLRVFPQAGERQLKAWLE